VPPESIRCVTSLVQEPATDRRGRVGRAGARQGRTIHQGEMAKKVEGRRLQSLEKQTAVMFYALEGEGQRVGASRGGGRMMFRLDRGGAGKSCNKEREGTGGGFWRRGQGRGSAKYKGEVAYRCIGSKTAKCWRGACFNKDER